MLVLIRKSVLVLIFTTLEEVRADAELCATEATKHITNKNLELVSQYDGKFTCDVGKALGIELYPKRIATGRSSFKKMVQDYAVTQHVTGGSE